MFRYSLNTWGLLMHSSPQHPTGTILSLLSRTYSLTLVFGFPMGSRGLSSLTMKVVTFTVHSVGP